MYVVLEEFCECGFMGSVWKMLLVFDLNQKVEVQLSFRVYSAKILLDYVKHSCKVNDTQCIALPVEQLYSRF